MNSYAKITEEMIVLPTYKVAPPEKCPLFIEKRAYQGSTGKVYPFPVTEKITDEKEDVSYKAIRLENEYLEVIVLPGLGGRIQRALDKTNGYDFVYFNHVVKPALVGLAGPWISGGIEFNWPQHHRPSTFSPVDCCTSENPDGSVSVFVGETDRMYGTKGMAEIRLYPGRAYIEINGQLYNRTDLPQTFLWWANPAVAVNDHTYSVFPPDVNAVWDHGKRAVSTFPIATGIYYKQDYSAGVDISRYKNIKVPTSYMAAHSDFDFIGNYDESKEAGLLHVADHHISPGKKQWTWGNGDFGRTWDKNLTDEDGPYIELMTGVFTDNQPDFTWLKPHEEKTFTQYFMPYKGVGRVSNATKDAAVSFIKTGENTAEIKVYTTSEVTAEIRVSDSNGTVFCETGILSPEKCFETAIALSDEFEKHTVTVSSNGKTLVSYKVFVPKEEPVPTPAKPIPAPQDIDCNEELWLAGMHLEQYRHATREPMDYYNEGLRRDPYDIRINNSKGELLYRRGCFSDALLCFNKAIERQTVKNPNPYFGESFFGRGLALCALGQPEPAFDAFYKATWSMETQGPAFYHLGCLSMSNGDAGAALDFAKKALIRNFHDINVRLLILHAERKLGHDASEFLSESVKIDRLCPGFRHFAVLINENSESAAEFEAFMGGNPDSYLRLAADYIGMGLFAEATDLLNRFTGNDPMIFYYRAFCLAKQGVGADKVKTEVMKAENAPWETVFPNRLADIHVLFYITENIHDCPMVSYYLGNLFYDKKEYKVAKAMWKCTLQNLPDFAMVRRNLAIYFYNKEHNIEAALENMEKAVGLDPKYPRYLLELDQLSKKAGESDEKRLSRLAERLDVVNERDDLFLRYISLENAAGNNKKALELLSRRTFHPWEGGEGKVIIEYKKALIALAKEELKNNNPEKAIEYLKKTLSYPDNLGEGKLPNVNDHETYYYMGRAYAMEGNAEKAKENYILASTGSTDPEPVLYYNDQPSDYICYIGLAYLELGKRDEAEAAFRKLIEYGEAHQNDKVQYDYFAVSLPEIEVFEENIQKNNDDYCKLLISLGEKGLKALG